MAADGVGVGMYVLELCPGGVMHVLHLLSELSIDHAVGIHGTTSLPDHGRVSTRADSAEAGLSPSSMQECRAGRR